MADRPPVTRTLPPIPTTGAVGNIPPAHAPRDTNAPLGPLDGSVMVDGRLITAEAMARANERELAPLTYPKIGGGSTDAAPPVEAGSVQGVRPVVAAGPVPDQTRVEAPTPIEPAAVQPTRAPRRSFGAATQAVRDENRQKAEERDQRREANKLAKAVGTEVQPAVDRAGAPLPDPLDAATAHVAQAPRPVLPAGGPGAQVAAVLAERRVGSAAQRPDVDGTYLPAASNSDSPSRGIPRAQLPKGKEITGGFGEAADGQYFPLDGQELLNVIWLLMDELAARLVNDLRFSIAATYPRVAVKAQIVVEGYAADQSFTIEKIMRPHDKTPIAVAEQRADEVVFVIKTERREFAADGEISSPPNALRQETGQAIPRKQWVGSGPTRQMADVVLGLQDQ